LLKINTFGLIIERMSENKNSLPNKIVIKIE